MRDALLSSIDPAPTSYFIYSSLSFFAPAIGGEIPGPWFRRAIGAFDRSEAAVGQELFRMERDQELLSRKRGRVKFYRAAPAATAEVEAGRRKLLARTPASWDGRWTLLHFQFETRDRVARDRLRSMLYVGGFAALGNGTFVHPRPMADELWPAIVALGVADRVTAVRGALTTSSGDRALVRRLWNLTAVARRYRAFLQRFGPLAARRAAIPAPRAFALRYALVFDFLGIAWADPDLPLSLLPPRWPGAEARRVARTLYRRLLPGALTHARSLLDAPRATPVR